MEIVAPKYYKRFSCTADGCTDNCCIGWEIDIDRETLQAYGKLEGDIGRRLKENISLSGTPHFRLQNDRCPFLNEQGLCILQQQLGEQGLCDICKRHPRFYQVVGNRLEVGLGLCCESACSLIFGTQEKDSLETIRMEVPLDIAADTSPKATAYSQALLTARTAMIKVLQEDALPIEKRLQILLQMGQQLQMILDENEVFTAAEKIEQWAEHFCMEQLPFTLQIHPFSAEEIQRDIFSFFANLPEPMDEAWPQQLKRAEEEVQRLSAVIKSVKSRDVFFEQDCEHLIYYFLYRYVAKAQEDGDILGKVKLSIVAFLVIYSLAALEYMDGKPSLETIKKRITKDFSKEVEYSTDNLDQFALMADIHEAFSVNSIMHVLDHISSENIQGEKGIKACASPPKQACQE